MQPNTVNQLFYFYLHFFKDIKDVINDVSLQQVLKMSAHLFEDEHSPFWQFFLQLFKKLVGQWQQQLVRCYV